MEFEERNKKPEEASKSLPMAVLITLIAVVVLLLYMGWQMISDDPSNVSDLNEKVEVVRTEEAEVPMDDLEMNDNSEVETETVASPEPIEESSAAEEKPKEVSKTPVGTQSTTHKIESGETLFSISKRYNVSESTLKAMNSGLDANSIKAGKTITVPVKTIHTVGPGDILRVVAEKYGITVDALMKANGKTKNYAERGEKLIIPL